MASYEPSIRLGNRVKYGPLRLKNLIKKCVKGYIHALPFLSSVESLRVFRSVGGLKNFVALLTVQKTLFIIEMDNTDELLEQIKEIDASIDEWTVLQTVAHCSENIRYFHYDTKRTTCGKPGPVPQHIRQAETNAEIYKIKEARRDSVRTLLTEEEQDEINGSFNTYENLLENPSDLNNFEKFRLLNGTFNETATVFTEEEEAGLFMHQAMILCRLDEDGNVARESLDITADKLLRQGTKNTATSGLSTSVGQSTKSSTHILGTLDSLHIIKQQANGQPSIIGSHSLGDKDERVREGKKAKSFLAFDQAEQKLLQVTTGAQADTALKRVDLGITCGFSANGTTLDALIRNMVSETTGKSQDEIDDDVLEDQQMFATDFEGFEYHHHPVHTSIIALAPLLTFTPGTPSSDGNVNVANAGVLAHVTEDMILPDVRLGSATVLQVPPVLRTSGHTLTLTGNSVSHHMYIMHGHMRATQRGKIIATPKTLNDITHASVKTGDDGVYPGTNDNVEVFRQVQEMRPMRLTREEGRLITKFDQNMRNVNKGISYCKANFVTCPSNNGEGNIVIPVREMKRMIKVWLGNTSSLNPIDVAQSCISQATHTVGHPKAHQHLEKIYEVSKQLLNGLDVGVRNTSNQDKATAINFDEARELPSYDEVMFATTMKDQYLRNLVFRQFTSCAVNNQPLCG